MQRLPYHGELPPLQGQVLKHNDCFSKRINDLPDHLLEEILRCLPLFSARNSKLVCKRWRNIISSPSFSPKKPVVFVINCSDGKTSEITPLVTSKDPEFNRFSLSFLPSVRRPPLVVAGCNDFLLCRVFQDRRSWVYVVCNPLTLQRVEISPPPSWKNVIWEGLICNQDRFAIMSILAYSRVIFTAEIFSSDSFEWSKKSVSFYPTSQIGIADSRRVLWDGMFLLLLGGVKTMIMAIDPFDASENTILIDPPHDFSFDYHDFIGVCQGRLRLLQTSSCYDTGSLIVRVWDLKEDYFDSGKAEWVSNCYKFPFVGYVSSHEAHVIGCHPDDSGYVYLRLRNRIVSCNFSEKQLEDVCILPYGQNTRVLHTHIFMFPWKQTQLIWSSP